MASWHELDTQYPKTFPCTLNFTEGCPKTDRASRTLHHCTLLKKVCVVGKIEGVVKMVEFNQVMKFGLKKVLQKLNQRFKI